MRSQRLSSSSGLSPVSRYRQVDTPWKVAKCRFIIGSFIGALSNLSRLCPRWPWLQWLCDAPNIVRGIIQGVLPPVLLAVVNLLLPIILRRE